MTLAELIHNLSDNEKKIIRKKERLQRKLNKAKHAVTFNTICIKENLLPSYTNVKQSDKAVAYKQFTVEYRLKRIEAELKKKEASVQNLTIQLKRADSEYNDLNLNDELKKNIDKTLGEDLCYQNHVVKNRTLKKLNALYEGTVLLPDKTVSYVNLSSRELDEDEKEFLDLGLNVHVGRKFDKAVKITELELLYQSISKLESSGAVETTPDLQALLLAEGSKKRNGKQDIVLSPNLKEAAKRLKNDESIIVRKADKTSNYVVLDRAEYLSKVEDILRDQKKFKKLRRNPIADLKKKVNNVIASANAVIGGTHFEKLVGEFHPGYLYGTVKTHKAGNPLRPIISQIPTPTYQLAKRLNSIITPYVPVEHTLRSSEEFIDIVRSQEPKGFLASLDVENLFTNVPVKTTTDIILDLVYNHEELPPPPGLSRGILEKMLRICTTECPFTSPSGHLYQQIDGVAMGSPLGVLYANTYMCHVEAKALQSVPVKPYVYRRYVDDIYLQVEDESVITSLKEQLEAHSVLNFTQERENNGKLHYLDVDIEAKDGKYITKVYRKPTDSGKCMNARSQCPDRYRRGVIRTYVRRAIRTCSNWELVSQELDRVKQILVNNNYSCTEIDEEIMTALNKYHEDKEQKTTQVKQTTNNKAKQTTEHEDNKEQTHKLYYKNQMNIGFKQDEKALKDIVHQNVKPKAGHQLKMIIYYKSAKTSQLVMKNNEKKRNMKKETYVVYRYQCPYGDCKLRKTACYIGHTTDYLTTRISFHLQAGAPLNHTMKKHNRKLERKDMEENMTIIGRDRNRKRLQILEAVHIHQRRPEICVQTENDGIVTLFSAFRPN